LVDQLLDHHVYSEIAAILNERGFRPGASARPGRAADRFSAKHVAYLMHTYGFRSRYDRLRQRGMLNKKEMADRLGVHEQTVDRWAKYGLIRAHFYNDHGWQLYEPPGANMPAKHCSRWDRLVDRAAGLQVNVQDAGLELNEVCVRMASCAPSRIPGRSEMLSSTFYDLIGIGAAVARRPLPHHRAYGSVHGGSIGCASLPRPMAEDRAT
jgi:hypothetical protein